MRGMANLPQGNQEILMVKDKVGRPPGEFGVSRSLGYIFPFNSFNAVGLATGRESGL